MRMTVRSPRFASLAVDLFCPRVPEAEVVTSKSIALSNADV